MQIEIKQFCSEDAIILSGDNSKMEQAKFNELSGPAKTIYLDGQIFACCGLRELHNAEAWCLISEELRKYMSNNKYQKEKKILLSALRQQLEEMSKDFYRIYAEVLMAESFCKKLGFVKQGNIWVRSV